MSALCCLDIEGGKRMKKYAIKSRLAVIGLAAILAGTVACGSSNTEKANAPAANPPAATPPPATAALTSQDKDFMSNAAKAGYDEIQLAQLALKKSKNESVRDFAQKIITDHTKANEDLAKIATKKNVTLPDSTTMGAKGTEAKLKMLSGRHFDQSFVKGMVDDHQDAISKFDTEATQGSDPDVKEFASSTQSTLKDHLSAAQELANKLNVAKGGKMSKMS
jgi:putative membrane protein